MKLWFYFLMILTIFFLSKIQAQEHIENIIEKRLESILENSEENIEASDLFERLVDLVSNPVNLNGADIGVLLEFQLINHQQYLNILNYRKIIGKIQSKNELLFLDHFSKELFDLIEPFIYAGTETPIKPKFSELFRYSRHQLFVRYNQIVQAKEGYKKVSQSNFISDPNKFYLGSPIKIYTRYKLESKNHFSVGFVLEKDPGEVLLRPKYEVAELLANKQIPLIDFGSFHLSASNLGLIKKVVLGDYHLQFAQGLTLWSNFAFNKSAEVTAVKRYAGNIIASNSTIENNFFRGLALTLEKGKVNLSLFYSSKDRDANITGTDEKDKIRTFTSLQNTGLHRTLNEVDDRNSINERILGARISFKSNMLQLGSTAYLSKWNARLALSEQLYKISDFMGSTNSCIGFDYQYIIKNVSFFGEYSISRNKGFAYLAGLDFNADSFSKFSLLWRNYQANYQNLYANAFAETSLNKNEKGLYLGFDNSFLPKWKLQFYLDVFKFPWLKSRANAPSNGIDYFIQLHYSSSEKFQLYFRFKHKNKQVNFTPENWFSELIEEKKESFRLNMVYNPTANLQMKSRVEWVNYAKENYPKSKGILIYQQVEYSFASKPVKLYFRFTNFKTDDFDSRIYTYENDVLYAFSIPAFYETGNHFYLLLNYKMNKTLNLWFKLGHTYFKSKNEIGTGNEKINGSSKTEIKFQLRLQI